MSNQYYSHTSVAAPPSPSPLVLSSEAPFEDLRARFGPPEIRPQDITRSDLIGTGSYGSVYRGRCRGLEVAVKIPLNQDISQAELESFKEEVTIMSRNTHPNVISLVGACVEPGNLQIVTMRCVRDLENLLLDATYNGSLFDRVKMAMDTAKGMRWLHESSQIIHGDLKPANLLLDEHGRIKITDFGFSQFKKESPSENQTTRGSLIWMAPEKILRRPITDKIDVFSFSIILWEMVTHQKPYTHHTDAERFCRAVCFDHERPPIPNDISPALRNLIYDCWQFNPEQRPSFREIVYRLSSILVDMSIDSPLAAAFWKHKFNTNNEECLLRVEWPAFLAGLRSVVGGGNYEESFFDTLKELLVLVPEGELYQQYVTMKKFDKVAKWFGPFFTQENGPTLLRELNDLNANPWFHGDITGEKAMTLLSGKPPGTFLIRLSSSDPLGAPFTLSLPGNVHVHMKRIPQGLQVSGAVYPSIQAFINANRGVTATACPKEITPRYVR